MKHIFLFMLSVGLLLLSGCDKKSGGAIEVSYEDEAPQDERCLDEYGIEEDEWSLDISDKSYIKTQICDKVVGLFDIYNIEMSCVSVDYNSKKNRFDVTLDDDGTERDFWIMISGCQYKVASTSSYSAVISDIGYWKMDDCFCKQKGGKYYYREAPSAIKISSSSSGKKSSSSSEKKRSSSSEEKKLSSSSGKKSSSSSEKQSSSSEEDEPKYEGFIKINSKYWTEKNLNVEVAGSLCYNDNPANCEKYGRLYTWSQAMGIDKKYDGEELGEVTLPHQGICPAGTHLPSSQEWDDLLGYIGQNPEYMKYFTNQLGGAFDYKGMYRSEGDEVLFWSSTEYEVTNRSYKFEYAWLWSFRENNTVAEDNAHKITGGYIRCIKDDGNATPSSSAEVSSSSVQSSSSSSKEFKLTDDDFVEVNSVLWMKNNLNIEVAGSVCYNDNPENCEKYGRLYTWSQAMGIDKKYDTEKHGEITLPYQGICPEGTHLPSDPEWADLVNYLGANSGYMVNFTNQLGGAYDYKGLFRSEGYEALFWSSTEYEVTDNRYKFEYAWLWAFHNDATTTTDNAHKVTGAYIRCVKNTSP